MREKSEINRNNIENKNELGENKSEKKK